MTVIHHHRNGYRHLLKTMSGTGWSTRNTEVKKTWSQGGEDGHKSRWQGIWKHSSILQQFFLIMQQNQFPRLSTHWPKFISPGATENHSNPFSTWQPFSLLKITNHVPPSPLFSRLNRPSAPLKIIKLAYPSTCLSPKNKRYFTSPNSIIFSAQQGHKDRKIYLPDPGLIPREIQFHLGSL